MLSEASLTFFTVKKRATVFARGKGWGAVDDPISSPVICNQQSIVIMGSDPISLTVVTWVNLVLISFI